ncbi:uncharacterized protein BDW43DRAFT_302469 [Aspergillus alliaceus]|uniref:uncharacterized protein n=1 Tax=Petromyces alliaceus TaxID=209559 RepID=UPI0012A66751|nr:uncharacterized protein BDW43DRAFT_302469 [Aspergillus alliaceus]KAB8230366.1 hypothetical protein BDW43DRAFT_302469 [Aspergillus alliaceus]
MTFACFYAIYCPGAYDLYLVDEDSIRWASTAHCLVPTGIERPEPTFCSEVTYLQMWGLVIRAQVENSNGLDGEDRYAGPAFPWHPDCHMILSLALTGLGAHKIDLELLYHTMVEMIRADGKALDLDYGVDVIREQEDYWKCIPGAEYCVTQSAINSKLVGYIEDVASYCEFDCPFPNPNRQTRVRHDPFSRLPVKIVHSICSYLSGDSMKALLQASFEVSVATHYNSFWKLFIKSDMPWFWEVHRLVKYNKLPGYLNYKGFYLWLDHVSTPKFGKADNFLGVANRRRIWGLCQEVKIKYDRAWTHSSRLKILTCKLPEELATV